ncbi:MAG: GNAT family N-acetyltransferase [Anaerolineae bacterium]|nr:GNAT family N-acetyltransferase [Anaerolineae bacterium]
MLTTTALTPTAARAQLPALVDLLRDAVESGASIGFMMPFNQGLAEKFWADMIADAEANRRILLAAYDDDRLVGTAQLALAERENSRHRAEVQKVLVHTRARRRGIALMLMEALEAAAQAAARTLLVLDTCAGSDAEYLYQRCGYTAAGRIPNYALFPDGAPCTTVLYYKQLELRDGAR